MSGMANSVLKSLAPSLIKHAFNFQAVLKTLLTFSPGPELPISLLDIESIWWHTETGPEYSCLHKTFRIHTFIH